MPRFTRENLARARETIALYPESRSALIPLLHLAQEQEGWISPEAMTHIAELLDLTTAEVLGTCSFYEMFKREPVGRYLLNVCTNVSCMLLGAYELRDHLAAKLGIGVGGTTGDGTFTLEEMECAAACDQAPCVLVNYRVFGPLDETGADRLLDDLRSGKLAESVPRHGTTNRVRRSVPVTVGAGAPAPAAEQEASRERAQSAPAPGPAEDAETLATPEERSGP